MPVCLPSPAVFFLAVALSAAPWVAGCRADRTPPVERSDKSPDLTLPSGVVVPNFRFAGVPGGIPQLPVVEHLEDFGAKPGDDVSEALERAVASAAAKGGGAVLIPAGEYFLERPVHLTSSGVVVRGSGMDATTLTFRWEPPRNGVAFVGTRDGEIIPPLRTLHVAAWNDSRDHTMIRCIRRLSLEINGKTADERIETESNEGPWFMLSPDNRVTSKLLHPGINTLRASVEYFDGRTTSKDIKVDVRPGSSPEFSACDAAVLLSPARSEQDFLATPLKEVTRGTVRIPLHDAGNLVPGDAIMLKGQTAGITLWPWHIVGNVDGNDVLLASPVRVSMQLENVRRMPSIRSAGFEDLTLRQTSEHWTSLVRFQNDVGCWLLRVRLVDAGRFPFLGGRKHFEMRDCVVDGARFDFGIGGGTAYLGFSGSFDGLITGTEVRGMRHAPNIQDGSMGCVIRDSRFFDSDAQFHSSPVWENLIENNLIVSAGGRHSHGSYGHGFVICARPPSSPAGTGNVFHRNRVIFWNWRQPAAAVFFEGGIGGDLWIIGNRFERLAGRGPLIRFGPTATTVRIEDNVFMAQAGEEDRVAGNTNAATLRNNLFLPLGEGAGASGSPEPRPATPISIHQHQVAPPFSTAPPPTAKPERVHHHPLLGNF